MIVVVVECVSLWEQYHLTSQPVTLCTRRCVTLPSLWLLPGPSMPRTPSWPRSPSTANSTRLATDTSCTWSWTSQAQRSGESETPTPSHPPSVPEQSLSLPPAVCCRYESGDHVAVFPTNDTALVNKLGQVLGVDLDVVISLNNLDGTTLAGLERGGERKHLDSPISAAPWQFWWGQAALWCKQRLPQTRRPSDVLRSQPRLNAATANILVEYRKKMSSKW